MALATVTTTFDLADYFGTDFDARRAKAWATTNIDNDAVHDTSTGETRIGGGYATIASDGTGSFTHWAPGADGNPTSWQTTYHFDVPDRTAPKGRRTESFGPFTVTTSGELTALVEEQAVPPTYLSTVTDLLDDIADGAAASATSAAASATSAAASAELAHIISDIDTPDALVAALVVDTDSETGSTLAASYAGLPDARPTVGPNTPLWKPPTQPAMSSVSSMTAAQRLTAWWEPLRTADPAYVTRDQLGMDYSGTYPIWAYYFTPPAYDRTVLVTANMHGGEKIGAFNIYKLMDLVLNHWRTDPWLTFLRWNVRLVVVPSVNPWGGSDPTGPRGNANGVDINRNWDYKWSDYVVPSPPYEKGAAAFSEPETQAIRDLVLDLIPEGLTAVIDCHDTGESVSGTPFDYYAYAADYPLGSRQGFVRDLMETLMAQTGDTRPVMHPTSDPQGLNWMASQGLRTATVEYEQRGTALSSENTTRALTWYGNVIMQAAIQPPQKIIQRAQPKAQEMVFATGATTITLANSGTPALLPYLTAVMKVDGPGLVHFHYDLKVGGAIGTAKTRPSLTQPLGPRPTVGTGLSSQERTVGISGTAAADQKTMSCDAWLDVHEDPSATYEVQIAVLANADVSSMSVYRYFGYAEFFPAEGPSRLIRMSASGLTAMTTNYPA